MFETEVEWRSDQGLIRPERACVVIPMYNEATVIADVVASVRERFTHVVCVDDGSRDGSAEAAARAGADVVRHPINLGQGAALVTGIRRALTTTGIEHIVTFDADGQHSVDDAVAMVRTARDLDVQVVLGSRFMGDMCGSSAGRRTLLRWAVRFTRVTSGLDVSDAHNGLRVLRRDVAEQVHLRLAGMGHASEILELIGRNGWTHVEHPTSIAYTEYSVAKGQKGYNALNIVYDVTLNRIRAAS